MFLFSGAEKLSSNPGTPWFDLYNQIGFGQWFRYLTGILEILGAALVMVSSAVTAGLVLLGCVMAGAVIVFAIVLRHPADALIPFALICALASFWLHRRRKA
jgi:hypothetical protein